MPVNKVVYGGKSLIDITSSTVTKESLAKGKTAFDKAGNKITGTATFTHVAYATFTNHEVSYDSSTGTIEVIDSSDYVLGNATCTDGTVSFTEGSGSQLQFSYDAGSKTLVISDTSTTDFTTGDRSSQNHIGVSTDSNPSPSENIIDYKWMKVS